MHDALLQGALVRLAVPNPETDSETIAAWTRDPEFQHLLETGAPRPWSARAVKADMAEMLGDEKPREHEYSFVIRALADDQLIGFTGLEVNHWSQRNAWISIGIGPRAFWGKGYGTDAMRVLMRFAFMELNLDRLTLNVFAYNERAQRSYLKAGFHIEGCQRERLRRGSRRYDMIFMGILRDEWQSREWRSHEEQSLEAHSPERQVQLPAGSD
jgi:RimJ/RimL family protein N-acetyltransferase